MSSPLSFEFTNSWFESSARPTWDQLIPQLKPKRILEIGSYEGASTCYLIDKLASQEGQIEIHSIDTWEGGLEHQQGGIAQADMSEVEKRFCSNTELAMAAKAPADVKLVRHKDFSYKALARLLDNGKEGFFDFVYIDGSHQAVDVITDAIMSYYLVRKDGILAFDDYNWSEFAGEKRDPLRCPKLAIDSFSNIFFRKVVALKVPLYQVYFRKIA